MLELAAMDPPRKEPMSAATDIRPGELAVALDPPADAALRFIGVIRTPYPTRDDCPRQARSDGPVCRIEIAAAFTPALKGLEAFERIEVIYWMHLSRRDLVLQSPK